MNQASDERHIATEIRVMFGVMAKIMRQDLEARLASSGVELSHLQIIMMRILNYDRGKTISELSKMIMCDPSTLVPSSEGLVRKGFIRRERDPQDRRRVLLYVTPEGRQVMDTLNAVPDDDIVLTAVREMGVEAGQDILAHMRQLIMLLPGGAVNCEYMEARVQAHLHAATSSDAQTPPIAAETPIRE
jgi:DNA-binding MarR family transcriptional regulator